MDNHLKHNHQTRYLDHLVEEQELPLPAIAVVEVVGYSEVQQRHPNLSNPVVSLELQLRSLNSNLVVVFSEPQRHSHRRHLLAEDCLVARARNLRNPHSNSLLAVSLAVVLELPLYSQHSNNRLAVSLVVASEHHKHHNQQRHPETPNYSPPSSTSYLSVERRGRMIKLALHSSANCQACNWVLETLPARSET